MPTGSKPRDEGAHAQLGCRSCGTTYAVPDDDAFDLRLLAFFDEHGAGHAPWIDLSAAGPLRLPRQREPQQARERAT